MRIIEVFSEQKDKYGLFRVIIDREYHDIKHQNGLILTDLTKFSGNHITEIRSYAKSLVKDRRRKEYNM